METRKYLFETKFKQFLKEAEDFIEFIDPMDLEVNVSVSGENTIVRYYNELNSYHRLIRTWEGIFEESDVLIIDIMLKEEAKDKPRIKKLRNSGKLRPEGGFKLGNRSNVAVMRSDGSGRSKGLVPIPDSVYDIEVSYPEQSLARITIGARSLHALVYEKNDDGNSYLTCIVQIPMLEKLMRIDIELGTSRLPGAQYLKDY